MARYLIGFFSLSLVLALSACAATDGTIDLCGGSPDCMQVTSDPVAFDENGTSDRVFVACPTLAPYFWSWTQKCTEGADVWLLKTKQLYVDSAAEPAMQDSDSEGYGGTFRIVHPAQKGTCTISISCWFYPLTHIFDSAAAGGGAEGSSLETVPVASSSRALDAEMSLEDALMDAMREDNANMEGTTYALSTDNDFGADGILQTPDISHWTADVSAAAYSGASDCTRNCDADFNLQECETSADCEVVPATCLAVGATVKVSGSAAKKLCVRPQDVLWRQVYDLIVSAQSAVDITTLNPPDGRFAAAIRNAISYLASTKADVTIRIATFWNIMAYELPDAAPLIADLYAGAKDVAGAKVRLFYALYLADMWLPYGSFNHSKIVAVDGRVATVGGQNQVENDYLTIHPVTDVTLKVTGGAAVAAHAFAEAIWTWICATEEGVTLSRRSFKPGDTTPQHECATKLAIPAPKGPGSIHVIAAGRLATGILSNDDQSDMGILTLLMKATKAIRISQQSVLWPVFPYNPAIARTYAAVKQALAGVDVYMVASALGSNPGRAENADDYPAKDPKELAKALYWFAERMNEVTGKKRFSTVDLKARLCQYLHIAQYRFNATDDTWPGGRKFALHGKVVISDDRGFYVGSQNFYPMEMQEYGLIVPDQAVTQRFITEWWNNLWDASRRTAVSGSDLADGARCVFLDL